MLLKNYTDPCGQFDCLNINIIFNIYNYVKCKNCKKLNKAVCNI